MINFEIPYEVTRYIHRVGRTARIGSEGISVTLCLENEVVKFKKMIRESKQSLFKMQVDRKEAERMKERIDELVPQIKAIVKEEVAEKELRKSEMMAEKAQNMVRYKEEIQRKPRKGWIESKAQKKRRN